MDDFRVRFRVGVVVLATFLIAGLLTAIIADRPIFSWKGKYRVKIVLPQAPGVLTGTPVRKNGILIGRVEEVTLADDEVVVIASIDSDRRIRSSERCRVTSSILGDAILEFVPGEQRAETYLEDGQMIQGFVRKNPFDILAGLEGDIGKTIDSLGNAGTEVADLAARINGLLEDADTKRLGELLTKMDGAMDAFTRTMDSLDGILGDETMQAQLRDGIEELPKLIQDSRTTMEAVRTAVASADNNLRNLEGLTGPLGKHGDQIAADFESAVHNLNRLLDHVAQFTQSINTSEGTVGQLIHNRELYDNVNAVVSQVHDLARKLRPILDDARAFSDKIARDPSRLGVRGAIERRAPIK
ncbi:MAG: MCE family protein [Pirellulales bacterium]|nr:MCE family protein [Pirellulales bacterium]